MQRPRMGIAYMLILHALLILLSYTIQDNQHRDGTNCDGWVLCHQLLIKKIFYRFDYSSILWSNFLNQGSFLSDKYSLCQVHLKSASTDIEWSELSGLFCESLEDKSVERNSDDGGLACEVPDRSLRIFKDSCRAVYVIIWLRITKIKLLLCWDFWY